MGGCFTEPSMMSRSGRRVSLINPRSDDITLDDIAHGLSRTIRFGGQCPGTYTVAEHSVVVSAIAEEHGESMQACLACLLHDAPEAYLGDVITPIKRMVGKPYEDLTERFEQAISNALELPWIFDDPAGRVHTYDQIALGCELIAFWPDLDLEDLGFDDAILAAVESTDLDYWSQGSPLRHPFAQIGCDEAKALFLRRYESLCE